MAKMDVEEIKKRKIEMESEITDMLKKFESESGVRASYVSIERKRPSKKEMNSPDSVMEDYDDRDLETVNIEIRFV
jgi:hypothetical protein